MEWSGPAPVNSGASGTGYAQTILSGLSTAQTILDGPSVAATSATTATEAAAMHAPRMTSFGQVFDRRTVCSTRRLNIGASFSACSSTPAAWRLRRR